MQQAVLVGNAEDDVEHAFLRVVELEQAARRSGPISEMVARTGWPCSPKMSQKTTGKRSAV